MKKYVLYTFLLLSSICKAQSNVSKITFGIKAGYNHAAISNLSSINGTSRPGFHIAVFGSSASENAISVCSELMFSKHGYSYKNNISRSQVTLSYLSISEFANINLTEQFKLLVGLQLSYLLHAKRNGTNPSFPATDPYQKTTDYYNRIDYGFAGGAEVNPVSGVIIGARYIIGLNSINKKLPAAAPVPPFLPSATGINLRNNILQLYTAFRF